MPLKITSAQESASSRDSGANIDTLELLKMSSVLSTKSLFGKVYEISIIGICAAALKQGFIRWDYKIIQLDQIYHHDPAPLPSESHDKNDA